MGMPTGREGMLRFGGQRLFNFFYFFNSFNFFNFFNYFIGNANIFGCGSYFSIDVSGNPRAAVRID